MQLPACVVTDTQEERCILSSAEHTERWQGCAAVGLHAAGSVALHCSCSLGAPAAKRHSKQCMAVQRVICCEHSQRCPGQPLPPACCHATAGH